MIGWIRDTMPRIAFLLAFLLLFGVIVCPVSAALTAWDHAETRHVNVTWNSSHVFTARSTSDVCAAYGVGNPTHPTDGIWYVYQTGTNYYDSTSVTSYGGTSESYTHTVPTTASGHTTKGFDEHWLQVRHQCAGGLEYLDQYARISDISSVVAPVAAFACDNVYSNPDAEITCTDLSTNDPDSWEFFVYDNESDQRYAAYTDSPWDFDLPDLGYYDVNLKACNSAGCDWENKSDYIRIMTFTNWTPQPTISLIPTLPWTNITTMNTTPLRLNITGSRIGNLTVPLLDLIDTWRIQILTLFLAIEGIFTYPIVLLNGFLTGTGAIFTATFSQLLSYTTVPILITASVIGWMPWQIQGLITLGLLFDLIILLLRGI